MPELKSPYAEVLVRVTESRRYKPGDSPEDDGAARLYDALIYSKSELPGLDFSSPPSQYDKQQLRGSPLRGVEKIGFNYRQYRRYTDSFVGGEQEAASRLAEVAQSQDLFFGLTQMLSTLLSTGVGSSRATRVWWSCDSSYLASLPWELLVSKEQRAEGAPSFVRGLPPTVAPPRTPVSDKLRLAFIHDPHHAPPLLLSALSNLPELEVVPIYDPPRVALSRAVEEGFELIHMVTEGTVSESYEGVLHCSRRTARPPVVRNPIDFFAPYARRVYRFMLEGSLALKRALPDIALRPSPLNRAIYWINDQLYTELDIEELTARELNAILRGSRVTNVSFSVPATSGHAPDRFDGLLLPKVYRAFASFCGTALPLPNLVAPLGAMSEEQTGSFWREFYTRLAQSNCYSVEAALGFARQAAPFSPVALFLSQPSGRDFARVTPERQRPQTEPTKVHAELQATKELMEQLASLDQKYGQVRQERLTDSSTYKQADERRQNLERELNVWNEYGEGQP